MKHTFSILLPALFLALAPAAVASTTWYVDGVNGSDSNNCMSPTAACKTIAHAISLASSGDSIMVAAATYTENLIIPFNLTITGAGASTTIIDGGAVASVVTITAGGVGSVTFSGLTIRNGLNRLNHGNEPCNGHGGGICAETDTSLNLTILDCAISGNTAHVGGGVYFGQIAGALIINKSTISGNHATQAGGIFIDGRELQLSNSTISGNAATSGPGGGLLWAGSQGSITNSTISGNQANGSPTFHLGQGGGIYGGGNLRLNNSTISGNGANAMGADGVYFASGLIILQNSILADYRGNGNCAGSGMFTSNGYNISNDNSCNLTGPGDLNDTDPKLGILQNNGGPTQTIALQLGSPAIDAGNPAGCTDGGGHILKTDQRGAPRPDKNDASGCDIGAYESQN
jgi:hypothetical protein